MISANIIEPGAKILLRNNIITQNNTNEWHTGKTSTHSFFPFTYEVPIRQDHLYYVKGSFKYTTASSNNPTYFSMYFVAGLTVALNAIKVSAANTEYTSSNIIQSFRKHLYNGSYFNSCNYSSFYYSPYEGVTGYVKDLIAYDVTELYEILKTNGIATSTPALKTWCDNNLEWYPAYTYYDITDKVTNSITNKIAIDGDTLCGNLIETDGMCCYSANGSFKYVSNTYFDNGVVVGVYNLKNNGAVSITRVTDTTSPFYPQHKNVLKIVTNGTADPGMGGFYRQWQSAANKVVVEKIVAKIPVGYRLTANQNSLGTNFTCSYLSNPDGTGNWQEYTVLYKCGSTGTFSTGGFISITAIDPSVSTTSVTWYVAYVQFADVTGKEYLKNYSILPRKEIIDTNNIFTYKFDSQNLCVNGDGGNTSVALPNSNYKWNKEVVAGNAKASIEWIKGAGGDSEPYSQNLIPKVKIDPTSKYKISLWVKSKADMSDFYLAVQYYTADETLLVANNVSYVMGTKALLTKALTSGDTQIEVSSNANWTTHSWSYLGFRKNNVFSSYCDHSFPRFNSNGSTGMVKGVSGNNIILLNKAYTGVTIPAGIAIVEGFSEYTFKYIAFKKDLVADTWVKIEAVVGGDGLMWDGAGGNWRGIPFDAAYMTLNGAVASVGNNSSGSVYFADIKIEEVAADCLGKRENKIQIQKLDK